MTTTDGRVAQTVYTQEEQDALFDAYIDAIDRNDDEAADRILEQTPVHPHWAKIILKVFGKDFLETHFNITEANRVLGEGWMDG